MVTTVKEIFFSMLTINGLQVQKQTLSNFFSNFAPVLLSLMSSTQRVYTHKILTPIVESVTMEKAWLYDGR